MTQTLCFLEGARLRLRPVLEEDYTDEYLRWLNDPEVNRWSQRRPFPSDREQMRQYAQALSARPGQGFVLAMINKLDGVHIGNISLVNIQLVHRCAEIAILIGRDEHRGQGLGGEAVHLLAGHAFAALNMHRVFAGTFNPAFARCVEKIGWKREGIFRERIWSHGRYHDQIWLAQLRSEHAPIAALERQEGGPCIA